MATWKKVIVSGSSAALTGITSSVLINDNLLIAGNVGQIENSGLTYNGTTLALGGSNITLTGAITASGAISSSAGLLGTTLTATNNATVGGTLDVTGNTTLTGNIAVNGGDITTTATTFNLVNGTATTVNFAGGASTALNIGNASGTTTFASNVVFNKDIIVIGTASFQETTNLAVADRFILLASGSGASPSGNGGIVIQQTGSQGVGEVFGWDATNTSRWGITSSFNANQAGFTPDAFMAAVVTAASTTPSPATRYSAVGNIYVSSGDESIWIYS
jgi:hypothetical protein